MILLNFFLWLGSLSISSAEYGKCEDPENHSVCLHGGSTAAEGNLFVDGLPVCDDEWDKTDAEVVCKQLGYTRGALEATTRSQFGQVGITFSMDDVACSGREDKIKNCRHEKRDDCGVQEAAGVVCDAITKEEEEKDKEMTENCFAKNVGYRMGGEMSGVKRVSSAMHCQRWCKENEDCVHFSFHSITKICHRYSTISLNDKIRRDSVVSGPRECLLNMTITLDNCKTLENKTICLVNPNNLTNSGNIFMNGLPVCDDNWSVDDGKDVCHHLGYHGIRKVTRMSHFGLVPATFAHLEDEDIAHLGLDCDSSEGAGVICDTRDKVIIDREKDCFIENLIYAEQNKLTVEASAEYADQCQNSCTEIQNCTHFTWFPDDNKCLFFNRNEMDGEKNDCPKAISGPRVCSDDPHLEFDPNENCFEEDNICLVGGASHNEGNVFILGKPVCDDGWNILNAHVACKNKGFVRAIEATTNSRFGNVGKVFGLDDVRCSGKEGKLSECGHSPHEDCEGFEAAGVICDSRSKEDIAKSDQDLSEKCFAKNVVYGELLSNEIVFAPTLADCQHYCQQDYLCQTFSYNDNTKECSRRKHIEDDSGTIRPGDCMTTPSRPDENGEMSKGNAKCIFPFTFDGKTYYICAPGSATGNIPDDSPWCSTKVDSDGEHISRLGEWGYCSHSCSDTIPYMSKENGVPCGAVKIETPEECAKATGLLGFKASLQSVGYWNGSPENCMVTIKNSKAYFNKSPTPVSSRIGYLTICHKGCDGENHKIPCCPQYVNGDGYGGTETKINFSPRTENGCQNACKAQHPTSIGVTQTHDGTSECFCEFGSPFLGGNKSKYKTCLFSKTGIRAVGVGVGVARLSKSDARYNVSNCIDGDVNTFCHSSYDEKYPYFLMEYPKPVLIKKVKVIARQNCCGDRVKQLKVSVTNVSPVLGELVSETGGSTHFGNFPGPARDGQVITFTSEGGIRGKYIVVQQEYTGILNLAEVEIETESYENHPSLKGKKVQSSTSNIISGPKYCPLGHPVVLSQHCKEPDAVCLLNGTSPFEGNIYLGGKPICDDQWNLNSAQIVCKQLGFGLAKNITLNSQFRDVQGPFSIANVECLGTEDRITDCSYNDSPQCLGSEAAGVICESDDEKLIREEKERKINECFVEDTCYFFSNLYHKRVSSADECQEKCQENDDCTQFSYEKDTWECIGGGRTLAPKTECLNIISGPKSCDNVDLAIKIPEDDLCRKEGQLCLWSKETGKMSSRGNVFVGGQPVCDDSWSLVDGEVVCRQLGFHGVREVTTRSHFGFVSGTFAMDDVECTGDENNITECDHEKVDNCEGGEAAGVVCDTRDRQIIEEEQKKIKNCFMEDVEFGGESSVSYENVTYVIHCHEKCEREFNCTHFTLNTELETCKLYEDNQLGKSKKSSFGSYSGPKSCTDNANIVEINDDHDNCAGIADLCLVSEKNISRNNEGNVFWEKKPVCDDGWDYVNANVVCRQMGNFRALEFKTESFFGEVSMKFSLDDVSCQGNETSLGDCHHTTKENCDGSEAAGVICDVRNETELLLSDQISSCFAENITVGPILAVHRGSQQVQYVYLPSSIDCHKWCQYNKLCGFFSFEQKSRKCYLRRNIFKKYHEEGFVSGPKECVNNTVELSNEKEDDCSHPGVACLGGGAENSEGNIYIEGKPVCDEIGSWTMTNSHVLCKQMGYLRAKQFKTNSYFGNVTGPFFATNVRCIGSEKFIGDCEFIPTANCLKMEAIGVVCETHSESFEGWVNEKKSYSYTCLEMDTRYSGLDVKNATINDPGEKKDTVGDCQDACQEHPECEYFTYIGTKHSSSRYKNLCRLLRFKGESSHGMENYISGPRNCRPCKKLNEFGKCTKYIEEECMERDAICLVGGTNAREGNVLVGGKPVCDDGWNKVNANVLCKQLGFLKALNATVKSRFGRVSIDYRMDEVTCSGSEAELTDCKHESDEHDCGHGEGAGVVCQPKHDASGCFKEHVIHDASMLSTEGNHFKPENVLKDDCDSFNVNVPSKTTYWLSPSRKTGGYIILDLGCSMMVDNITLKNTHNGKHNDRGLANFTISLSNSSEGQWHSVLKDQLIDVRNMGCAVPLKIFSLTDDDELSRTGQFVKLDVDTFYGNGGGLQYFNIEGHQPDPSSSTSIHLAIGLSIAIIFAVSVIAVIWWIRKKGCRWHSDENTESLSFSNLVAQNSINAEESIE